MEVFSAPTTKESSKVLQGVCAYVEVRSQNENRSKVIAEELRKLGAEVHDKLNMNVTHVVFKDGTSRTWQRAKKLDIPLVSVLWVDGCKKTLEHINEKSFSVDSPEKDDRLFPVKRRKFRSMQPKDLNEEFEDISKRCDRKRKRAEKNKAKQNSCISEPLTPRSFETVPHLKTPPSMKARLLELSKNGETRRPIFAEENADDIKIKLFDNTEKKSHPLSLPQSLSPIPCEKDFSEISPNVKKLKFKTPDLVSDIKLENISNNWKNLQTNNQNATIVSHDSSQQITKMSVCERTSMEHTMTSAPLSPISSNMCNLSTDDFILDKPIHRKRHKHRETLDFLGITNSNLNGRKHSTSISVQNKTEMSETRTSIESSTPLPTETLSSSKTELVTTCHEKTFTDKTLFCNNSVLTDNVCTQSNAPENLQPQCDKIEMSETKTSIESSTPLPAETLSSSKAELVTTCHERTFADKTLLYNNSILTNACTQISAQDSLQSQCDSLKPQCDSLKTNVDNHDSLSQSSFQSQVFPVNQMASVPENPHLNLATTTEDRNISLFRKPIKKHLVMTSMNSEEQSIVKSAVKSLGGCVISDNVRKSTTHVICGNSRRTLNLLHGLIQGCWLVSKQWIFKSMEAGRWIDEHKFEMTDDYPATKVYRQNKQKENLSIFKLCGPMFISPSTSPPKKDLVRFVQFCGGQVINNLYDADFYVSDEYNPFILSVSPQWILDSIMHQKVFPLEKYQLGQPKPQSPEY